MSELSGKRETNQVSLKYYWPWAALLALVVILFYLPVLNNDFVNLDDREQIYENPNIRHMDLQSLQWMLTNSRAQYWIPLTWFSLALNYQMGGLNPAVFHLTNVFLHALNTLLVFFVCLRVLERAKKTLEAGEIRPGNSVELITAFLTALLFGLHPIHVESVVWATERKDLLYACFYLGAILVYLDFASSASRKNLKLFFCFLLFLLSLMSKPMALTLPFVLLILDYWPLRRFKDPRVKAITEKWLFWALMIVVGLYTHASAAASIAKGNEWFLIMNGFRSIVFYLVKMVLPLGLTPFYPFPHLITPVYLVENVLAFIGVLVFSAGLFYFRKEKPYLWTAWLFYLATLAPVLGFIQVGDSAAADRYTYLSSLGLFLPASAGFVSLFYRKRMVLWIFISSFAFVLGFAAIKQMGVWKNSQTFWEFVVNAYPEDNPKTLTNLGFVYLKAGRFDDALDMFNRAVAIPPPMAFTHEGMGIVLVQKGLLGEAIQQFKTAIELDPRSSLAHRDLAEVYNRMGMRAEAAGELQAASRISQGMSTPPALSTTP